MMPCLSNGECYSLGLMTVFTSSKPANRLYCKLAEQTLQVNPIPAAKARNVDQSRKNQNRKNKEIFK